MSETEDMKEERLMVSAVKVTADIVEEFGPLNTRPVIDVCLRVIANAILSGSNPPAIELARIARELPEIVERQRPGFEAIRAAERKRGN